VKLLPVPLVCNVPDFTGGGPCAEPPVWWDFAEIDGKTLLVLSCKDHARQEQEWWASLPEHIRNPPPPPPDIPTVGD
jgi:hypothetical protein